MRNFLLGVATALAAVIVVGFGLLVSLGSDEAARPATAMSSPSANASSTGRPATVPPGQTWLGDVALSSGDVVTDAGGFRDVAAKGQGVTLSEKGLRADRLQLDVTLPWQDAAEQVGKGVTLYAAGPGRAGLSRTVTVLGQDIPVKASAVVRAEGGQLVIEPETVDLGGPAWLDGAASALVRTLVTFRQPVQGVPDGMRLTDVSVIDTGFRASLEGSDVTITQ